jgi:hypothetical protein
MYNNQMGFYPNYSYYMPQNTGAVPDVLTNFKNQYKTDRIFVQGEAGAKAYLVAPNNTVILWDSEANTIYIKSADASGVPSMRILDYTDRNAQNVPLQTILKPNEEYVTKEEFMQLKGDFERLFEEYKKTTNKKKVKEVEEDV